MEAIDRKKRNQSTPIISYGIILYYIKENVPYYLLYQRRDTFEYMDFLRGMWTTENQLISLFKLMSTEERQRIREYTFRELWDDLWIHHDCKIYKEGYIKAKRKYDSIRYKIPDIIDNTDTDVSSPPWGFPKGKKNGYHEDPLKCAMREFTEETRIELNKINVVEGVFFTENFKGSNNKNYITQYYLAEASRFDLPSQYETIGCIRKKTLSEEALDIKWFSINEIENIINSERHGIIRTTLSIIEDRQNI